MAQARLLDSAGNDIGSVELNDAVFATEPREALIHEVAVRQSANLRQGTAKTKTRSEASGGGAKPWKQKGLGRARAGSIRSPLWRGGGTAFGPRPRDYHVNISKKKRCEALRGALSARAKEGKLVVIEPLQATEPKTKPFVAVFSRLAEDGGILLILGERVPNVLLSVRNVARVRAVEAEKVSLLDVLRAGTVMVEKTALDKLESRLS
jgi:large subunit ribosomal protein L4